MVTNLGFGALLIAFFLALYCFVMSLWGGWKKNPEFLESSRIGLILLFPLVSLSMGCLVYLLVDGHYEVQYVYSVISRDLPFYLRITALWGGQAGSLLFWAWLMTLVASLLANNQWGRDGEFFPWVTTVLAVTLSFFLSLSVFFENPFNRFWELADGTPIVSLFRPVGAVLFYPENGYGLNPLLRHPGMVLHPPLLYMGFVSFVIPFAYGMAALITGRVDDRWISLARRWTLMAWLFLSLGLILGSRWAYDVLGWGGYWSWDPVEIAAFMPWLTGTALLHSVITQERLGMFKRWNMVLVILTYDLVIFGTFLTRSGVLSSVHAFSESSLGPIFLGFIAAVFAASLGLILWRWEDLRADGQITSIFSRESLFLFNNLIFMGIFFVCFWGVVYPVISEFLTGQKVTIGPPFYERATGPLFAALLLLMGLAPLTAWGHSTWKTLRKALIKPVMFSLLIVLMIVAAGVRSAGALCGFGLCALVVSVTLYEYAGSLLIRSKQRGERVLFAFVKMTARNRQRYGGYIIHLGVVMMSLGIIGIEVFQTETQGTIARGQTLALDQFTLTFKDLAVFDTSDGRNVARAVVGVKRGDQPVGEIYPRRDFYYESQQPVTVPGILGSVEEDIYVVLVDWKSISSQGATFKVYHNPLVDWLWIGGWIFMLGTLVAAWPEQSLDEQRLVRLAARQVPEDTST